MTVFVVILEDQDQVKQTEQIKQMQPPNKRQTQFNLEVVGGVDDGSPPVAWTQIRFCKLATGFGAALHYQARSPKKCYQAVEA